MFFEIGVLKNFGNFIGKHLCWSLFLIGLKRDSNIWKNFLKNFNYTSHYGKIQYRLLKEKYSHRISRTVLNSYCSNIKFLCFLDITINMYTWWLQEAWDFNLYTTVFCHSLVIKCSTNLALCWSSITLFIWYILHAPSWLSTTDITLHIIENGKIQYKLLKEKYSHRINGTALIVTYI